MLVVRSKEMMGDNLLDEVLAQELNESLCLELVPWSADLLDYCSDMRLDKGLDILMVYEYLRLYEGKYEGDNLEKNETVCKDL